MDYIIDENLTILMHSCEKFVSNTKDESLIDGLRLLAEVERRDDWFSCNFAKTDGPIKWANRLGILSDKYATLRKPPLFAYLECIRRSSGRGSTIVIYEKNSNSFDIYLKPDIMKC